MPKSRRRKDAKQRASGSGIKTSTVNYPEAKRRRDLAIIAVIVLLAVGYFGYEFWQGRQTASAFDQLIAEGQDGLDAVRNLPNDGRRHLQPGQLKSYSSSFPTSGDHEPVWIDAGFYDSPQPPTRLVHSLEHGHIVIYYDEPDPAVMAQIKEWAGHFTGAWDGVVVSPMSGLGSKIVLTAWRKRLDMQDFEPAVAAAFIDAHRGRGPENPVR